MIARTYIRMLALILVLSSVLFAGVTAAQDTASAVCPTGQGYWQNHADTWPVTDLMLGSQMYTQVELIGILSLPAQNDASLILAHQLLAAKLNIAAGADSSAVSGIIVQGDALLAAFTNKLPFSVAPSSTEGTAMTSLGGVLDVYNSGALNIACALTPTPTTSEVDDEATEEPVDDGEVIMVIEGPVEAINVNIITIFDFDITVEPNHPMLTLIHVGDVIHVEGHFVGAEFVAVIIGNVTGDLPSGASVVIEGAVQTINVNIITINNITIQLDPNDPILINLHIGDNIHVEGDFHNNGGVFILVVVNVVIINDIDIHIDCGSGMGMGMGCGMGMGSGS